MTEQESQTNIQCSLNEIRSDMASLDRRTAVLETRLDHHDKALEELKLGVRSLSVDIKVLSQSIGNGLDRLRSTLSEHVTREDRDRMRLLWSALMSLLAALGTFALWAAPWVWGHLANQS